MSRNLVQTFLLVLTLKSAGLRLLAQGQIFLSNLGETSSGSVAVASDSLIATPFLTGNDTGGYSLDSVQLLLSDPTGNPNDFSVSIHHSGRAEGPGTLVGYLSGPNPSAAGVFSFLAASNLALSPLTIYWVKVSGGTPLTSGSFLFNSTSSSSFQSARGWMPGTGYDYSTDGITWNVAVNARLQFAVNATVVPEPSVLALFALGVYFLAVATPTKSKL